MNQIQIKNKLSEEPPNPNYLLCTYVDLEHVLRNVTEAMKELEKAVKVVMNE